MLLPTRNPVTSVLPLPVSLIVTVIMPLELNVVVLHGCSYRDLMIRTSRFLLAVTATNGASLCVCACHPGH